MAKKKRTTKKKTQSSAQSTKGRFRILALDGGGIRGVMTAHWLAALEKMLPGPLADYFDLVAGTSTGSILACGIARRIPAEQIVDLYRERGRDIFPSTGARLWSRVTRTFSQGPSAPKYSDAGLEKSLRAVLEDIRMGDLPDEPKIMVTAYNTFTRHPVYFKSWREKHAHVPLWEAAKASSSAPTFFPAHVTGVFGSQAALIDGGVVANNPSACAIAEAIRIMSEDDSTPGVNTKGIIVGSFGTGVTNRPISIEQAREWGAIEWAVPVISVLMDGAADSANYISEKVIPKGNFKRFDVDLKIGYDDMDDASETNINSLLSLAEHYLDNEGGMQQLKDFKKLII